MAKNESSDIGTVQSKNQVPIRRLPPDRAVETFSEVQLGYSPEEAVMEAGRARGADFRDASAACPFSVDTGQLVALSAKGDFVSAYKSVLEAHPWPGILGRTCHKYCEAAQSFEDGRQPIAISALERAAFEYGGKVPVAFRAGPSTGKKIAVVGAGASGSAVSYRLRQLGHAVVVFDRLPVGGGMMSTGYPEFRMPMAVVQRENAFATWGVDLRLGVEVDPTKVENMLAEFDAVVIASGRRKEGRLDVPGEELHGVHNALILLSRLKLGMPVQIGKVVAVFGAGFTAQDISRAARRLGSEVKIYYRRTMEEMPVGETSRERFVRQQASENAPYVFQVAPVEILGKDGRVVGVRCMKTRAADINGRPGLELIPGSEFVVPCDTVIAAVGETADLSFLPMSVRQVAGVVWVEPQTFQTNIPRLFCVGAAAGVRGTVAAFRSGLDCAAAIDRSFASRQSTAQG